MTPTLTLPAFAKINLNLRVLAKRGDGYHEIDTVFQTVSLHDTLKFARTETTGIVFSCDDRALPMGPDNLVVRAAHALRDRFAVERGARIRLEKRIPAQAGLGGGSSDAAVTLMGLANLWDLKTTADELNQLASGLGADVPFFLAGGTARGTGIGERTETLADAPEMFLLIVKPNAQISTVSAYQKLDERCLTTPDSNPILLTSETKQIFDAANLASLPNDFELIAFEWEPEIVRARDALLKAGARVARLCGSGSGVFGVFDSKDAQRRAIQAIELETGWRVFPCKTVQREQYQSELPRWSAGA